MFRDRLEELDKCISDCVFSSSESDLTSEQAVNMAHELLSHVKQQKGIVYVIGNGGSAGIASHFSSDLMKTLQVSSQTLYDPNLMTCLANDLGYENAFSYPLQHLLKLNDLLVAISSSGKSPNILNAVYASQALHTPIITLSGFLATNPLRSLGTLNFWIDKKDYGLIEIAHFFLLHTIIDQWNQ